MLYGNSPGTHFVLRGKFTNATTRIPLCKSISVDSLVSHMYKLKVSRRAWDWSKMDTAHFGGFSSGHYRGILWITDAACTISSTCICITTLPWSMAANISCLIRNLVHICNQRKIALVSSYAPSWNWPTTRTIRIWVFVCKSGRHRYASIAAVSYWNDLF